MNNQILSEKDRWDQAAVDYQSVFRLGLNDYNASMLQFWHEQGMLFPGARVIDIGCGVGKYGTYLANLGYDVTLTDISDEMLRHAEENMSEFNTPWATYCCDFNDVSGTETVFKEGFDLAICTMSPAVHDVATVRKMSNMTRKWCFLTRFRKWEQSLRDLMMQESGISPRQMVNDLEGDCDSLIQSIREAGYHPQVRQVDYNWADRRSPRQMADYLCHNFFREEENPQQYYPGLLRWAESHADGEGMLTDAVNTKVYWIYWNTEENR